MCYVTLFYKEALRFSFTFSQRETFCILNGLLDTGTFSAVSMGILKPHVTNQTDGVTVLNKLVHSWVVIGGSRLALHAEVFFQWVLTDQVT